MANLERKIKKGTDSFSRTLCGKNSPVFAHEYTCTASILKGGKDSHPYMSVTVSGGFKIPVLKLILVILSLLSAVAILKKIVHTTKGCSAKRKLKKPQRETSKNHYESFNEAELNL